MPDYEDKNRLELWDDGVNDSFRASQAQTIADDARATQPAKKGRSRHLCRQFRCLYHYDRGARPDMQAVRCSGSFATRHERSPGYSPNREKGATGVSVFGDCTGHFGATTPKKHWVMTCWNSCTPRAWTWCILEAPPICWTRIGGSKPMARSTTSGRFKIHRTTGLFPRKIRYFHCDSVKGMGQPRVSAVWRYRTTRHQETLTGPSLRTT